MSYSPLMTVMVAAVRKAARGVVRDFGEVEKLQVSKKGAANFVTNADLRTDKILIEELQKARPRFSFLTEEHGVIEGSDPKHRFVIDPIDGTTNFIHAIPYVAITVAAQAEREGQWHTTAGIVYDPILDELFWAERGKGAFRENAKLRVSTRREDLLLSTASPRVHRQQFKESLATFGRVAASGATLRCSGSAALDLAYVAAGRIDGTWYQRLNAWDALAGILLVEEAMGMATAVDGSAVMRDGDGSVLATNGLIHKSLVGLLAGE